MFITWYLEQVDDTKHTPRVPKTFIFEKRIHVTDWSSNSPDFNLVEYIIKNNVEKKMPGDVDKLERFMKMGKNSLKQSKILSFMSIKWRCELVSEKTAIEHLIGFFI